MKQKIKTIEKINEDLETKNWFFEKINKTDKCLVRLTKKKKRAQIKIYIYINEGDITAETTEIQKIMKLL